jgi:hypothetical protein
MMMFIDVVCVMTLGTSINKKTQIQTNKDGMVENEKNNFAVNAISELGRVVVCNH